MTEENAYPQPPEPNPDLRALDRLVGTWQITGGAEGQVTYEWMEGGYFLLQHVDLEQYGVRTKGIEVIGHERPFGGEPSEDINSRYYDSMGNTLDYVYEVDGDVLTIWGGEKGSPAFYRGTLDEIFGIFGEDRVLYGSDWPNSDAWKPYADVLRLVQQYFATKGSLATEKYFWKNSVKAYRWIKRDASQPSPSSA